MCDNCNTDSPTIRVALITGKRGRPPQKDYCEDCRNALVGTFKLPGEKIIREVTRSGQAPVVRTLEGFDSAALFLLGMNYENLFEQVSSLDQFVLRCKGCGCKLNRPNREEHYNGHRRDYTGKIPVISTTEVDDA